MYRCLCCGDPLLLREKTETQACCGDPLLFDFFWRLRVLKIQPVMLALLSLLQYLR